MEGFQILPYQYEPESDPEDEAEQHERPPQKRLRPRVKSKTRSNRGRAKNRVNLGSAFALWRQFRTSKAMRSDAELATFLLDWQNDRQRVDLGAANNTWKNLREEKGFRTDAEMALFLINVYLQTKSSGSPPERPARSSAETGVDPLVTSPSSEPGMETPAAPSGPSSETESTMLRHTLEPEQKDGACKTRQRREKSKRSENKENRDSEGDVEGPGVCTSLSVGDGRYLLDLGSSSEIIVDEECILQLFRLCPECNRQCRVTKRVHGLKLVVHQACCFCNCRNKWTNLPDADKKNRDFHINGNHADDFPC